MVRFARVVTFVLAVVPALAPAQGRDTAAPTPQAATQDGDAASSLMTLSAVLDRMAQKQGELAELQKAAAAAGTESQKLALLADLDKAQAQLDELQRTLDAIATGVDLGAQDASATRFDAVAEVEKLLRPLIEELKDITAEPRQLSELRSELQRQGARLDLMQRGLERVRRLREMTADERLRAALTAVEDRWRRRATDARNAQTIIRHQLDERERDRPSLYESTRSFLGKFFRERGLNLLLAAAAFALVLFGLNWLYKPIARRVPLPAQRRFAFRLIAVVYHISAFLLALTAALMVLYAAGDWILLGLALLFLLGVLWAGWNTVPRFLEQIGLMLNLGSIRESERLVLDGLPWRVDRIHFHVRLVNPALTGGVLRMPIRQLVGLRSRPCREHEPWFPSLEGDWVVVDGQRGRVLLQTPETVQVDVFGARVTYTTADYLAAKPTNLTHGFRVRSSFGIDYSHQAIATGDVPRLMRERLDRELRQLVGDDNVARLDVEFQAAGASSLDYIALADLRGGAASFYERIPRLLQRALVDVCNERGWTIPFPQLTVHRAAT
ncbi:MAG: hypothetical protein R3F56_20160 [Planctomycetota bacterium]